MPCFSLAGLKCGPADVKAGGSHLAAAWIWNACSPAGIPLSVSLIKTPAGVCKRSTVPTSLPLLSRSAALADWAAAGKATAAVSSAAAPTVPTYFKIVMTQLLGVAPGTAGLDADCGILPWKIARGTSVPARVKTWLALEGGSDVPRQAIRRARGLTAVR